MKQLLVLVLLVLGLAANASVRAEDIVLIYSFTEKSTEYSCDINGITDMNQINDPYVVEWNKSIKTETGYFIVQWTSQISVNVWTVKTEKIKGKDGKMHKWASASGPAGYSFATANLSNKTTWLVGTASEEQHTLLAGDEKPVKILGKPGDAATKLAGTRTWYYEEDSILHVGSSVISLKWQSKLTNEVMSDLLVPNGEDAAGWLLYYLESKGYGNGL